MSAAPPVSVMLPTVARRLGDITPFASLVKHGHAHRLWQGTSLYIDERQGFGALGSLGLSTPVGIGVALTPLRHPFDAAHQARSLAALIGQPVIAGFGPGGTALQTALLGAPYPSPLDACREYIQIVRGLLDGDTVDVRGETYSCRGALPPLATPRVDVGLGVLRGGMARLAGAVADRAITWLAPPHHVGETIMANLERGASTADRPVPRVVAIVPAAVLPRGRRAEEVLLAGSTPHLTLPHYLSMLASCGADIGDDLQHNAREAVRVGATAIGSVDQVVDVVGHHLESGVDEVVLNSAGIANLLGLDAAESQLVELLDAINKELGNECSETSTDVRSGRVGALSR